MKKSEQLKQKAESKLTTGVYYLFTESELQERDTEIAKEAYPNKEADGCVFCGKCGTAI